MAKKALGLGIHAGNDRKGETVEEAKEDLKKAVALILEDRLADVKRGLPAVVFETVIITPVLIKEAIDCSITNRLSFWDASIVVAAESAKCKLLWTEDLNHGQIIRGVRVENPLKLDPS